MEEETTPQPERDEAERDEADRDEPERDEADRDEPDRDEPERDEEGAPSRVDAMGKDKRRQVIGHAYAPTRARQLTYYGIFIAVIVALFIGAKVAIDQLDTAPDKIEKQAPWSNNDIPPQRFQ